MTPLADPAVSARQRQLPPLAPGIRTGPVPIAAEQLNWAKPSGGMGFLLQLTGELDVERLEQAFSDLADRHEILRTRFTRDPDTGIVSQETKDDSHIGVDLIDLTSAPLKDRTAEVYRDILNFKHQVHLRFGGGDVLPKTIEPRVYKLSGNSYILHVGYHHIAFDNPSTYLMVRDLSEFYRAREAGDAPTLPPLRLQYADYAVWQSSWLTPELLEENKNYWMEKIEEFPNFSLPARQIEEYKARGSFVIPPETWTLSQALARSAGVTPTQLLYWSIAALLSNINGQKKFVIRGVLDRRPPSAENVIGCFSLGVAFPIDMTGDPTFTELLERSREHYRNGMDRRMSAALHTVPLSVMVNIMLNKPPRFQMGQRLKIGPGPALYPGQSGLPNFPMPENPPPQEGEIIPTFWPRIFMAGDLVYGVAQYKSSLVDGEMVAWFIEQFPQFLKRLVDEPQAPISQLQPPLWK